MFLVMIYKSGYNYWFEHKHVCTQKTIFSTLTSGNISKKIGALSRKVNMTGIQSDEIIALNMDTFFLEINTEKL